MLEHVVHLLAEATRPIVVVAAPEQNLPTLPQDLMVVRDAEKGRGPLEGLAAGLAALAGRADAAFASSCDVPFLKPEFVRRLASLMGDHAICVPKVQGRFHPLAAVYRLEVSTAVASLLAENRLRPAFLFDKYPTRFVTEADLADVDPDFRSLRNLNHPEEYEAALAEHQATPTS
jgi:molybdopterin-guanine dinucleotide biosynthesis protein A